MLLVMRHLMQSNGFELQIDRTFNLTQLYLTARAYDRITVIRLTGENNSKLFDR